MISFEETRFGQAAIQTGLLDRSQLKACWDEIPQDKRTPDAVDRRLARKVVEAGLLTRWQAQQLLAGLRPQALHYERYVLEDVLGQGGMGRVFLARDSRLKRRVALKVLSRERMNNPRALARFRREARVGAQLQHENLVRIYDEGEVDGHLFLVMEYIEGKTLGRIVNERGPLPFPIAARIASQVALGLEHAHQKGLVHRDVNPMNIIIDRFGIPKLTDLGLAIDLADEGEAVTRDGATVGTFDYISPEQARSSRQIDIRTDIYSLGCTLYHALAGRVPFPQPSLPEKLYAHQMIQPEPLTEVIPGFPAALWTILQTMMGKKPSERYATPGAVAQALRAFEGPPLTLAEIEAAPEVPLLVEPEEGGKTVTVTRAEALRNPPEPASVGRSPSSPAYSSTLAPAPAPDDVLSRVQAVALAEPPPPASSIAPSDPSLTPAQPPSPCPEVPAQGALLNSDIFGVIARIDAADLPLSDSRSSGVRRTQPGQSPGFNLNTWGIVGGIAGLVLIIVVALSAGRGGRAPSRSNGNPDAATATRHSPEPATKANVTKTSGEGTHRPAAKPASIAVHWLDTRTSVPVATLRDAIQKAVNKPAEIVLSGDAPIPLGVTAGSLNISGSVTIRASAGSKPVIHADWSGNEALIQVRSDGRLKVMGISFDCQPKRSTPRSVVLSSGGVLSLEGCTFLSTGTNQTFKAVLAAGPQTTISGCVFRCLASPIAIEAYDGCQVVLRQSLFLAPGSASSSPSWAISLSTHATRAPTRSRKLLVDRTTLVGMGLLELREVTAETPIEVEIRGSVIQAPALLAWSGSSPFPDGLKWTGTDNRYAVEGPSWVVSLSKNRESIQGGPTDLASWCRLTQNEPGSQAGPVAFVASDLDRPFAERPAADFALSGPDATAIGIDPEQVGR